MLKAGSVVQHLYSTGSPFNSGTERTALPYTDVIPRSFANKNYWHREQRVSISRIDRREEMGGAEVDQLYFVQIFMLYTNQWKRLQSYVSKLADCYFHFAKNCHGNAASVNTPQRSRLYLNQLHSVTRSTTPTPSFRWVKIQSFSIARPAAQSAAPRTPAPSSPYTPT